MSIFLKYASIGVLNTLLHWGIFFLLVWLINLNQGLSNLIAFLIAVTFSFFMNARFTFNKQPTGIRYLLFLFFMGVLSYGIGYLAEQWNIYPIFTLVLFSLLSLILGFLYSKVVVFN